MPTQASGSATALGTRASSSWPVASRAQEHMIFVRIWRIASSSVSSGSNARASSIVDGYATVADSWITGMSLGSQSCARTSATTAEISVAVYSGTAKGVGAIA